MFGGFQDVSAQFTRYAQDTACCAQCRLLIIHNHVGAHQELLSWVFSRLPDDGEVQRGRKRGLEGEFGGLNVAFKDPRLFGALPVVWRSVVISRPVGLI